MLIIITSSRSRKSCVSNADKRSSKTREIVFVWASSHQILLRVSLSYRNSQSRLSSLILQLPVRLANLMKVLTSDAVQDPTRVEARVRREVAMRKHTHEKMNAERKLTDDQRREKVETKKIEEEKKGIYGAVFK